MRDVKTVPSLRVAASRWLLLVIATASALGLVGCSLKGCGSQHRITILQREWTANAEFAGDVWAEEISQNKPIKLSVREGSELLDPIKAVRSGDADFGVASADKVLRENEGGANLVVIAASTYKSPVVFLSHPKDHISAPKDFKGHIVGIQSGTNTELVLRSLLRHQNLLPSQIKIVESGWGTANFESGAIDVLAAFDYDEPVQLTIKSVPFHLLNPEPWGVHYVGTVYFTRRALIIEHPELVQEFMDDLTDGWRHALADPAAAMSKLSARFKDIDSAKEAGSLARGREYFQGEDGHLLYASQERWNTMASDLIAMQVLKSFSFDDNVDYRFLEKSLHQDMKP